MINSKITKRFKSIFVFISDEEYEREAEDLSMGFLKTDDYCYFPIEIRDPNNRREILEWFYAKHKYV